MSRRRQERAELRALQRHVWGDKSYTAHVAELRHNRQRRFSIAAVVVGAQLLLLAIGLFAFASPASAHTSQITIGCKQVEFNYAEFPQTSVNAHESITIDGAQGPQRDFQFTGPTAIDIIAIAPGPGSHTVDASTNWTFFGQPQGSANLTQEVSDCTPESTSTTTTTMPTTSTTISSETTSLPTTSTTLPATTTTTAPVNTTTTIASSTTSMTVGPKGSTTTSNPVPPQTVTTSVVVVPPPTLPFTGSSNRPLSFALGALGLGAIALGIGRMKRTGR